MLKRLVAGFPPRRPGFYPRSGHVGFVVDKVALRQVFSEFFGFPCKSSFHRLPHNHHLSSGAGTIGQQWPTSQVDSVSPHPEKLKKKKIKIKKLGNILVQISLLFHAKYRNYLELLLQMFAGFFDLLILVE
jgi:hypothetical protein